MQQSTPNAYVIIIHSLTKKVSVESWQKIYNFYAGRVPA
jgi:hypothetical protein